MIKCLRLLNLELAKMEKKHFEHLTSEVKTVFNVVQYLKTQNVSRSKARLGILPSIVKVYGLPPMCPRSISVFNIPTSNVLM